MQALTPSQEVNQTELKDVQERLLAALDDADKTLLASIDDLDDTLHPRYRAMRKSEGSIPARWVLDWSLGIYPEELGESSIGDLLGRYWSLRYHTQLSHIHVNFPGHKLKDTRTDHQTWASIGDCIILQECIYRIVPFGKEDSRTWAHLIGLLEKLTLQLADGDPIPMRDVTWVQLAAQQYITKRKTQSKLLDDSFIYQHAARVSDTSGRMLSETPFLVMDLAVIDDIYDADAASIGQWGGIYSALLEMIVINTSSIENLHLDNVERRWSKLIFHEIIHTHQVGSAKVDDVPIHLLLCEGPTDLYAWHLSDETVEYRESSTSLYVAYMAFVRMWAKLVGEDEYTLVKKLAMLPTIEQRHEWFTLKLLGEKSSAALVAVTQTGNEFMKAITAGDSSGNEKLALDLLTALRERWKPAQSTAVNS